MRMPEPGRIELSWMRVPDSRGAAAALVPLLSDPERRRATRFRHDADRHRYMAARACLRLALSEILMTGPREIRIGTGGLGAPTLEGALDGPAFSVSHAGAWALVAVGGVHALGVDVEMLPGSGAGDGAGVQLHESAVPASRGGDRDLLEWVGKEAILKALGCGLALDPGRIAITVRADGRIDVHHLPAEIRGASGIRAARVDAPPGYVAALATITLEPQSRLTLTARCRSAPVA